ncbi:MAG TPA: hypothetical protein VFU19_02755 [Iamia sp.]|nr:hypothetical protein [Iamia sp.]
MTQRSEAAHRRAERKARLMNGVLNRSLTRREAGLDKVAKTVVARLAPPEPPDPELHHPDRVDGPS